MGVNGLLRLLQPISIPRPLSHFQGQTLAVDGYAWLHRAAASCAEDLVRNADTTKLVQCIDKRIRLYEAAGVNLYFVFDGAHTDMKARVSAQRRRAREKARTAFLLNQSQNVLGGVTITPDHAAMIVAYLKARGIRFVVAPFEADSQLVWLEKNGYVDGILSEDGDLLVFGASCLLTKADGRTGDCVEVRADRMPTHLDAPGLRSLAIISGCDYSQGVTGLGPIKTSALVKSYAGNLSAICASLMRTGRIDDAFVAEARRADLAFQFQRVWDPKACSIVHLNDPAGAVDAAELLDSVIGPLLPRPDAHRIARCVVDPNDPKRALPVSPAVARFVARLPPIALATPNKYSSPAAVRSMVERRLPLTPTNSMQTSPFFRQKPASDTSSANKENACVLPSPPASIIATESSTIITTATTALKRSQGDAADICSPSAKALRTDTVANVPTPTRARAAGSARQLPNPVLAAIVADPKPQNYVGILRTSERDSADEPNTMESNTMEKLAALRRFAYTKN